jgi:hypothetical protein
MVRIPAYKDQIARTALEADFAEYVITRGPVGVVIAQQNSMISRLAAGKITILDTAMLGPDHSRVRGVIAAGESNMDAFDVNIRAVGQINAGFFRRVLSQVYLVVTPSFVNDGPGSIAGIYRSYALRVAALMDVNSVPGLKSGIGLM